MRGKSNQRNRTRDLIWYVDARSINTTHWWALTDFFLLFLLTYIYIAFVHASYIQPPPEYSFKYVGGGINTTSTKAPHPYKASNTTQKHVKTFWYTSAASQSITINTHTIDAYSQIRENNKPCMNVAIRCCPWDVAFPFIRPSGSSMPRFRPVNACKMYSRVPISKTIRGVVKKLE